MPVPNDMVTLEKGVFLILPVKNILLLNLICKLIRQKGIKKA